MSMLTNVYMKPAGTGLRLKVIACRVMLRELYAAAGTSKNVIDIAGVWRDLHNTPDLLRQELQKEIDRAESDGEQFDAIVMCYGLCSNALIGLSSKKYKLIIPRAHDCVTLLLGSKEQYAEKFKSFNGAAYWYTRGWLEHSYMPSKSYRDLLYAHYLELYGEDNAEFLMEQEQDWLKKYDTAAYVHWDEFDDAADVEKTKKDAASLNWKFEYLTGSSSLIRCMLDGKWDDKDFLIVPPGQTIYATNDESIIGCKK